MGLLGRPNHRIAFIRRVIQSIWADFGMGKYPFLWIGLAVLVITLFIFGLVSAPINYDTLTYHLPRTTYWMQLERVQHYPTSVGRQLYQPPFAEYVIAQWRIITGNDAIATLVQWFAFIGVLIGVGKVAQYFDQNPRTVTLAIVIAATTPNIALQVNSAKNDVVLAMWLIFLVYFVLRNEQIFIGATLGLALLTKGTAFIYCTPIMIWWLWRICTTNQSAMNFLRQSIVICIITLVIIAPHYVRNYQTYGHPISAGQEVYSNQRFGLDVLVSNITRNLALQLPITQQVKSLHSYFGWDIDDLTTSWTPFTGFYTLGSSEDRSGSPLHMILIVVLLIPALLYPKTRPLTLVVLGMSILFVGYLKWQPWHGRQHISLFVVWSPILAVLISRAKWLVRPTAIILLIMIFPFILLQMRRPAFGPQSIFLLSEQEEILAFRGSVAKPYFEFARELDSTCNHVQLTLSNDSPEYILHILLPDVEFSHVATPNTCAQFNIFEATKEIP